MGNGLSCVMKRDTKLSSLYCVRSTYGLRQVVLTEEADVGESAQIAQYVSRLALLLKFRGFKSRGVSRGAKHEKPSRTTKMDPISFI